MTSIVMPRPPTVMKPEVNDLAPLGDFAPGVNESCHTKLRSGSVASELSEGFCVTDMSFSLGVCRGGKLRDGDVDPFSMANKPHHYCCCDNARSSSVVVVVSGVTDNGVRVGGCVPAQGACLELLKQVGVEDGCNVGPQLRVVRLKGREQGEPVHVVLSLYQLAPNTNTAVRVPRVQGAATEDTVPGTRNIPDDIDGVVVEGVHLRVGKGDLSLDDVNRVGDTSGGLERPSRDIGSLVLTCHQGARGQPARGTRD